MSRVFNPSVKRLWVFLGLLASPILSQAVHPGYTLSSLRPSDFDPQVSGLDFLPDGRLVISTWEGFGKTSGNVYIMTNAQSGNADQVTYKNYAANLNEPLGVKVVGGEIYLLQKDKLTHLPDLNKDGVADTAKTVSSGWIVQPGNANLEFAMGMVHRDSVFYGGLATPWPLTATQSPERGCIIQMSPKTGGFEAYACGMRTPDGMTLGPENELFVTENQGNWVPNSKLLHVKKGRFFGVHKTPPGPFDAVPETPPVLWLDHGVIGISPTQPVYVRTGVYQGQMIAGDANFGTLQRYFLEKVAGEYQGAVFRFSGGLEAAAHRIVTGPDGAFYIGGIGTSQWTGWDWAGRLYGLQRMATNGTTPFDAVAMRSMGYNKIELEFTEPVTSGADQTWNYTVRQWQYTPEQNYGGGKGGTENLSVSSATLSPDKKKVTLEIGGMKLKHVLHLKWNNLKSASDGTPWTNEAWYTQNAFGPGITMPVVKLNSVTKASKAGNIEARAAGSGTLSFNLVSATPFTLEVRDLLGTVRESFQGQGSMTFTGRKSHGPGVYVLSLRNSSGVVHSRFVNP